VERSPIISYLRPAPRGGEGNSGNLWQIGQKVKEKKKRRRGTMVVSCIKDLEGLLHLRQGQVNDYNTRTEPSRERERTSREEEEKEQRTILMKGKKGLKTGPGLHKFQASGSRSAMGEEPDILRDQGNRLSLNTGR